jgi:hypothetical protein
MRSQLGPKYAIPVTYPGSRIGTCQWYLTDLILNEIRTGRYFQMQVRTRLRTEKLGRISVGTRFGADQMPSLLRSGKSVRKDGAKYILIDIT